MTRPDLDALAALLAEGTQRPWSYTARDDADSPASVASHMGQNAVAMCPRYGAKNFAEDAALIVAAVNALPALIACVRELERERDEARAGMFDGLNHAGALVGRIADQAEEAARTAALAMRERCAQACESFVNAEYRTGKVDHNEQGWTQKCAAAIRALEP